MRLKQAVNCCLNCRETGLRVNPIKIRGIGHAFSLYQCGRCPVHPDSCFSAIQTAINRLLQPHQHFFVFKPKINAYALNSPPASLAENSDIISVLFVTSVYGHLAHNGFHSMRSCAKWQKRWKHQLQKVKRARRD